MAFNNVFPATYQQYYPQYQQQNYQAQPAYQTQVQGTQMSPANSSIIWVQGEAGAKSYLVAPNNTVQLWDSEKQTIYLKSADASGMPSMKVLDYTIRENASHSVSDAVSAKVSNSSSYATKDDLDALSEQITSIRAELDIMNAKHAKKVSDDE